MAGRTGRASGRARDGGAGRGGRSSPAAAPADTSGGAQAGKPGVTQTVLAGHFCGSYPFKATIVLVCAAAFFRGLALRPEQLFSAAVFGLLFLAAVASPKSKGCRWPHTLVARTASGFMVPKGLLDWASLALPAAYAISSFGAASIREALQADLRTLAALFVFWLIRAGAASGEGQGETNRTIGGEAGFSRLHFASACIALTGAGLSLLGLGAAAGLIPYRDAFYSGRIASALQYPNALSAYLIVTVLAAVACVARALMFEPREPRRMLRVGGWGGCLLLILVVFFLTKSRGGIIVLCLTVVLFAGVLQLLGEGRRGMLLTAGLVVIAVLALVISLPVDRFLIGAQGREGAQGSAHLAGAADLAGPAGSVGLAGSENSADPTNAPREGVIQRAASINLEDYNAWSRIQWTKDALRMGLEHPVTGAGGGAWEIKYLKYQSYGYWTTQVHNHFAQLFVETGAVGMLAQMAILAGAVVALMAVRQRFRNPYPVAAAFCGPAALYMHGMIDFTLSLQAVNLLLWALLGVLAGVAHGSPGQGRQGRGVPPAVLASLSLAVVVTAVSFLTGFIYGQRAVSAREAQDFEATESSLRRAIAFDPLTASYYADLAVTRLARAEVTGDRLDFSGAEILVRQAVALDPYYPGFRSLLGSILISSGSLEAGLAEFRRAVELNPFLANRYEDLGQAEFQVALQLMRSQRSPAVVRRHLDAVLEAGKRMASQSRLVPQPVPREFRLPARTPGMELLMGKAKALLGKDAEARQHLSAALSGRESDYPLPPSSGEFTALAREALADHVQQVRSEAAEWLIALGGLSPSDITAVAARAGRSEGELERGASLRRRSLSQAHAIGLRSRD